MAQPKQHSEQEQQVEPAQEAHSGQKPEFRPQAEQPDEAESVRQSERSPPQTAPQRLHSLFSRQQQLRSSASATHPATRAATRPTAPKHPSKPREK